MTKRRRIRRRYLRLLRTVAVAVALVVLISNPGVVLDVGRSVGTWLVRLAPLPISPDGQSDSAPGTGREGTDSTTGQQAPGGATQAFAMVKGLTLRLPAQRLKGVAYHEAAYSAALALKPLGRCARNVNRYKFDCPPTTPGPRYMVMSSRGRAHPATSAVDVAMSNRSRVVSPVTGRVAKVRAYWLYGRYRDYRVSFIPAGRPNLAAVMIHLRRVQVRPGDRVIAGTTVIALPRRLPFHSQVNSYVGRGVSHVHLEVKRIGRQGS